MLDLGMWVHAKPNILKNGRTTHLDPEEPTDPPADDDNPFDPEEAKRQMELEDPFEPRLKGLSTDPKIKSAGNMKILPWNARLMGDPSDYKDEKNPGKTVSNGVVVVRSQIWPGAYSMYYKDTVYQIYLGNGQKKTYPQSMFPVNPPTVLDDPEEYDDGPEPTPLHPPPVEEKKEDDDNKEDGDGDGDDE